MWIHKSLPEGGRRGQAEQQGREQQEEEEEEDRNTTLLDGTTNTLGNYATCHQGGLMKVCQHQAPAPPAGHGHGQRPGPLQGPA